ncbi:CBS domain protein [bacterium BMS3Bbin12]|nr:CBS domain protein [bacterium BMS3Abin12]GBE47267.1 CBS domain protein [bacterium BMS3Bbin12]GBE50658.1 CBS domain protein [bacterium BMS3Bbin13]HDJ86613.1 CBS domain-containing protein [Chromatiales bacterium]HDK03797.1 CBS domain-containing protein [Gammaproteobacteria bacterium]
MSVELIMNRRPVTLQATDTVAGALELLLKHRYRSIPIVDADRKFIGLFEARHLLGLLLPKAATVPGGLTDLTYVHDSIEDLRLRLREVSGLSVRECLENHAEAAPESSSAEKADDDTVLVRPGTPLTETLLLLYRGRCSLPVVDAESGRLLGVVSYWEVFRRLAGKD